MKGKKENEKKMKGNERKMKGNERKLIVSFSVPNFNFWASIFFFFLTPNFWRHVFFFFLTNFCRNQFSFFSVFLFGGPGAVVLLALVRAHAGPPQPVGPTEPYGAL